MTYISSTKAKDAIASAKRIKDEISKLEDSLKSQTDLIKRHLEITGKDAIDTPVGRACLVKANRRNWKIERLKKDFGFTDTDPRYSSLTPYEFVKLS